MRGSIVHVISATAVVDLDNPTGGGIYLSMCGERLGTWGKATTDGHPVGNFMAPAARRAQRVNCAACRERMGIPSAELSELVTRDASLGVGHVWTSIRCPSYRSHNPIDCVCQS